MKNFSAMMILVGGLCMSDAAMARIEYDYGVEFRGLAGYADVSERGDDKGHLPSTTGLNGSLTYHFNRQTSLKLYAGAEFETNQNLVNLNQGHWGEEVYARLQTAYGDFYAGQMPNASAMLGVSGPDLSVWQISPAALTDFVSNPNWWQKHRRKYYNSLTSTVADTDGSSLKTAYLSPEYGGTTFGLSFTPENNANDGPADKFAPYAGHSAYAAAVYHRRSLGSAEMEAGLSYSDYFRSHKEYTAGMSVYYRGWTMFGSWRQTTVSAHDSPLAGRSGYHNLPAWSDGYRHSRAWNAGVSYEWAVWTSVLSYFNSKSKQSGAENHVFSWHNSIKPHKNLGFYVGLAYVDFRSGNERTNSNRGPAGYVGVEVSY